MEPVVAVATIDPPVVRRAHSGTSAGWMGGDGQPGWVRGWRDTA